MTRELSHHEFHQINRFTYSRLFQATTYHYGIHYFSGMDCVKKSILLSVTAYFSTLTNRNVPLGINGAARMAYVRYSCEAFTRKCLTKRSRKILDSDQLGTLTI